MSSRRKTALDPVAAYNIQYPYNMLYGGGVGLNPLASYPGSFRANTDIVQGHSFVNRGRLLHNNVAPIALDEQLIRYSVVIDSKDRSISRYPNPYCYTTTFKVLGKEYSTYTGRSGEEVKEINLPPSPFIPTELRNVSSATVNFCILPKCYTYTLEGINSPPATPEATHTCTHNLDDDRMLLLDIKELQGNLKYSTNQETRDAFDVLVMDDILNKNFYITRPGMSTHIYPQIIDNIPMLTIKFKDSCGRQLNYDYIDKKVTTPGYCICDDSEYTDAQKATCVCKYTQHPLNPLLQNLVVLDFLVLNDSIAMRTPYQRELLSRD